jgi:plastocyanin
MVPIVVMLTLASIGLASAHTTGSKAAPNAHRHPRIIISSFTFTTPRHVLPGARVVIVNKDPLLHSVTSDDGTSFSTDAPASSRVSFTAPMTPGRYPFHCRIHSTMHGTLRVRAAADR